jgi:hypothetical protein
MVILPLRGCDLESLRQFQIIGASVAGSAPSGGCPMTAGEIVSFELTVGDGTNCEDRGGNPLLRRTARQVFCGS